MVSLSAELRVGSLSAVVRLGQEEYQRLETVSLQQAHAQRPSSKEVASIGLASLWLLCTENAGGQLGVGHEVFPSRSLCLPLPEGEGEAEDILANFILSERDDGHV